MVTTLQGLFTPEYRYFWASILALALFWPLYRMILTRALLRAGLRRDAPAVTQKPLKRRSAVIAAVICVGFSFAYTTLVVPR
ncbi:MAG: hypothetical protein AAF530_14360 [Pseudomonadota bacterium]